MNSLDLDLVSAIQLCIVLAAVLALLFHRLKQPALLAYILAGLVLGLVYRPLVGGSVEGLEQISHLGLTLLLFIIGLELDLKSILGLGKRAATAVMLQAPIAIAVVLGIQWAAFRFGIGIPGLALSSTGWFYFAVAVALSSTAVVVKLLADRFDLTSQAGRISVLTLIAQDIWAVLALSYVSSAGGTGVLGLVVTFGGAALVAVAMSLFARYLLVRVFVYLGRTPDLVAIAALAWCFVGTTALGAVGLSAEMGALLAGLSLSVLPVKTEILSKMVSLRDFFMALFFVALGLSLPAPTLAIMGSALVLVGIVIAVRLLLFTPTLLVARFGPVVSIAAAVNLAQLSEFSLLLVAVGIAKNALSPEEGAVISYAMMLSVLIASYAIKYNYRIALLLGRLAGRVHPAPAPVVAGTAHGGHAPRIVFLGYHRHTSALLDHLVTASPELVPDLLVIDFNLKQHDAIKAQGVAVAYGDVSNPETLRHLGVPGAAVVLCTITDTFLRGIDNQKLVRLVRTLNPHAYVVATADSRAQANELLDAGASAGVCPSLDAAPTYREQIERGLIENERPR